jgi:hypothetical protein
MTTKLNGDEHDASQQSDDGLESDISLLSGLLSSASTNEDESPEGIAELLGQLETANGIAMGVEGKLDDIIGHLDDLLSALEVPVGNSPTHQQSEDSEQAAELLHNSEIMKQNGL